jgi:hypothetical protein
MLNIANFNASAQVEVFSPVRILVEGKTATERKLSVARVAQPSAQMALIALGGKVGKECALGVSREGLARLAVECANSNYRGLAQYLAGITGASIVIAKRADYESLDSFFESQILTVEATAKNRGMREKDGVEIPGAKLALLINARNAVEMIQTGAAKIRADRDAKAEAAEVGSAA